MEFVFKKFYDVKITISLVPLFKIIANCQNCFSSIRKFNLEAKYEFDFWANRFHRNNRLRK